MWVRFLTSRIGGLNPNQAKELAVKNYLCSQGYYEIQTIAMTAKTEFDMFLIPEDAKERKVVELLNPITENLSIMRTLMAPAMVRVIENNIKNGHEEMRFFEMANVYLPKALPLTEAPEEKKMICLGSCGATEDFSLQCLSESQGRRFGTLLRHSTYRITSSSERWFSPLFLLLCA